MRSYRRDQFLSKRLITCGDGIHAFCVIVHSKHADFGQGRFLGLEVVVETALLDTHAFCDVPRTTAVISFLGKNRSRSADSRLVLSYVFVGARIRHEDLPVNGLTEIYSIIEKVSSSTLIEGLIRSFIVK